MEKLSLGVPTKLVQNQWYAVPSMKCTLFCSAAAPTIVQSSDANQATTAAVTLTGGAAEITGSHLRITSAVATDDRIILKRV